MIKVVLGIYIIVFFLHPMEAKSKKVHERHTNETVAKRQYVNNPHMQYKMFLKRRILPLSGLLPKQPLTKTTHKHVGSKGIPLYHDSNKYCDDAAKKGSFKINDGVVQGSGTYEIEGEQVNIDLSIKITPAPGGETTPVPGAAPLEAETTAAPVEAETTPAPGVEAETTAAPVEAETTAAPVEAETTAAPVEAETTAAPVEAETTAAPVEAETTAAPAATTPSSSSGDVAAFEQEALQAHNDYRTRHDAPAMTLDQEMSTSAYEWAKYLGENDLFDHSPEDQRENQGENIAAWCDAQGETATSVTKRWYDEVCDYNYDFSSNEMNWSAGHFTQVVWIASTKLGIGYYDKIGDDGWVCRTIVARYTDAGNYGGAFLENVKQGSFDANTHCSSSSSKRNHKVL